MTGGIQGRDRRNVQRKGKKTMKNTEKTMDKIEESIPEDVPYIFISSVTGYGIPELKDALWDMLNENID